jgi:hypothetical protein
MIVYLEISSVKCFSTFKEILFSFFKIVLMETKRDSHMFLSRHLYILHFNNKSKIITFFQKKGFTNIFILIASVFLSQGVKKAISIWEEVSFADNKRTYERTNEKKIISQQFFDSLDGWMDSWQFPSHSIFYFFFLNYRM